MRKKGYNKKNRFAIILLMCLTFGFSIPAQASSTIAWIGGWMGKSGSLTDVKMNVMVPAFHELREKNQDLVLLSCGSMLGPSAVSYQDNGRLILSLMNHCRVDAMAVGPHDFFAGPKNILERAAEADFPFLCTNLRVDTNQPIGKENWEMVKPMAWVSRPEKSVMVLAVVCPGVASDWPNWDPAISFEDPIKALAPYQEEAAKADMVVLLSNMSFADNLRTLQQLKWVDVILTNPISGQIEEALDFNRFDFGLNDGRRICWSMPNDEPGYGLLKTIMDNDRPWLLATPHRVASDLVVDSKILAEVSEAENLTLEAAGSPICHLSAEEHNDIIQTYLGALRAELSAEVAVIHESAIQGGKVPENPTALDIQTSFPFPDRAALMQVPGTVLRDIWNKRENNGTNGQVFQVLGLTQHKNALLVNGRPLRDNDSYRLATTEYLAVGGFNLLPANPRSIRSEKLTDLLIRYLQKTSEIQRAHRQKAIERRPILRQKLALSGSYDQLDFSPAADGYQYKDPKAVYTGSDIPGLVGFKHLRRTFNLDHEAILDYPDADTTMRVNSAFWEMEPYKLSDNWQILARHAKKALNPGFFPFLELQLTGAHFKPDIGGKDRPLFGKAVAGMTWKASEQTRLFLGLGHLKRFSVDDKPGNSGLNLGFEVSRQLRPELTLSTIFDGFMTQDSDKIRTFDSKIQLQAKLFKRFSLVVRETYFGWKDSSIGRMGIRRETFTGLGYDLTLRNF